MGQRGRPTSAASMVGRLKGSTVAKERMIVILANLGGTLPVAEALRRMRLSRTLFRRLRKTSIQVGLRALEPRPRGRPVREVPRHERKIRELQEKILQLEEDLALTRVREELALLIPWTARRQKKTFMRRASRRAVMRSSSPVGSRAAATRGSVSPGVSA